MSAHDQISELKSRMQQSIIGQEALRGLALKFLLQYRLFFLSKFLYPGLFLVLV